MHASHNHSAPRLSRGSSGRRPARRPRVRALRGAARRPARGRRLRRAPRPATRAGRLGCRRAPGLCGNRVDREQTGRRLGHGDPRRHADGEPLAIVRQLRRHPIIGRRATTLLWDADYIGPLRADGRGRRIPGSSASSCRAAPATSRRSTTGSATRTRARTATRTRDYLGAHPWRRPRSSPSPGSRPATTSASPRDSHGDRARAAAGTPTTRARSAAALRSSRRRPSRSRPEVWDDACTR